ncbi:MAG: HD domain-containing protein [archaeon]
MKKVTLKDILDLRKNSSEENRLIKEAYKLVVKVHKGQKRASGAPYIEHLLEVGYFLAKMKMDYEIIVAGLLHDSIEDADVSLVYVRKYFGKRVAKLVDGMSWILRRGVKDWPASYKKFSKIAQEDTALVYIKMADFRSNFSEMQVVKHKRFFEKKAGPRNKTFFIPFFREVGLTKFAEQLDRKTSKFVKEDVPETLYDYINKSELRKIKKELKV